MKLYHFTNAGPAILSEGFKCPLSREYINEFRLHLSFMYYLSELTGIEVEGDIEDVVDDVIDAFMKKHSSGTVIWVTNDMKYEHDLSDHILEVTIPKDSVKIFERGDALVFLVDAPLITPDHFKLITKMELAR